MEKLFSGVFPWAMPMILATGTDANALSPCRGLATESHRVLALRAGLVAVAGYSRKLAFNGEFWFGSRLAHRPGPRPQVSRGGNP